MSNIPKGQAADPPEPVAGASEHREAAQSDFAHTRPDGTTDAAGDWWPESADGQCSESAALFAASQPAPLSVV